MTAAEDIASMQTALQSLMATLAHRVRAAVGHEAAALDAWRQWQDALDLLERHAADPRARQHAQATFEQLIDRLKDNGIESI